MLRRIAPVALLALLLGDHDRHLVRIEQGMGVRLALITNGAAAPQRAKVVRFDLTHRFHHIQIEGEHGFGKPEERAYRHALQTLGVAPEDTWSQASSILDVAEKTPAVRFCLAHSCRYDHECLDRVAALPNTWFDCSAHRIHCESVVHGWPNVAPPARRFAADYRDPAAVMLALASAFPTKFIWGSDSPFQSYVDSSYSLRSTYAEETACLHALPAPLKQAVAHDNLLALLQLKDASVLTRG